MVYSIFLTLGTSKCNSKKKRSPAITSAETAYLLHSVGMFSMPDTVLSESLVSLQIGFVVD